MSLPKKFLLKTSCCQNNITILVNDKPCLLKHIEQVGELSQWHVYEWLQDNDEQEECQKEKTENESKAMTNDIIQALKELPFIQEVQLNQTKKKHAKK